VDYNVRVIKLERRHHKSLGRHISNNSFGFGYPLLFVSVAVLVGRASRQSLHSKVCAVGMTSNDVAEAALTRFPNRFCKQGSLQVAQDGST
jgi:hypothetical protein